MASLAARTDQNAASFLVNSMAETTSVDEANEMAQLQQQHNTNSVGDESQGCAEKLTGEITGAPEDGHNGLAVAEEEPVIDIVINNVVSSFNTRCHLNLKQIATEGTNVEYKRANGMLNMKIRHPYTTASMWSSGKVTCTGATSEADAHIAARRFARKIQLLGFDVRFCNFRVVNVLATCSLPFGIKITNFSRDHPQSASYEPELHPGVTYKIKSPKATLKIFSTGSITVTAPCVANVQTAIEHIFPLVYEYKSMELHSRGAPKFVKKSRVGGQKAPVMYTEKSDNFINDSDEFSDSDASFDSEESHD